ncbi:flavodoxin family protein [Thermodesulfobacteriota bacterium]
MKIVSVFGSPRKKGNTATVLGWVEAELEEKGHDVHRINLTGSKINGCIECFTCKKKPDEPGCPQKDDALEVFDRILEAEAVIYASPVFCWSWTAQMKSFIDRHFCLVKESGPAERHSLLEGKKIALVATSAGPLEGNADLLVHQFDRLAAYLDANVVDRLLLPLCTLPQEMSDDAKAQALKLAHDLVS